VDSPAMPWLAFAPWSRRPHRRGTLPTRPRPRLEELEDRNLLSGFWTPLTNLAPSSTGTMMLLTDGTVMAQGGGQTNQWHRLTPDSSGSYVNGTWSNQASMNFSRLYLASNVLTDGRVLVLGGEYSSAGSFTNTGEIYDPVADSWTRTTNFPLSQFGDDPSSMLPDGRILLGHISDGRTYAYDPSTDTYTQTGTKLLNDSSDEETWVQLPDQSILSYDVFHEPHAQRYIPAQDQWVDAGTVPVNLSGSSVGSELGGAFALPDGRAFFLGANGHTAFYDLNSNTWTAGTNIPGGLGCDDAPAAMMPNGHVLFAADTPLFRGPTRVFEFDPTDNGGAGSYTDVTPAGYNLTGPSYVSRMVMLPSGEVLFTNGSGQLLTYTVNESPDPSWQPTISGVNDNGDGTFTLSGTLLSGISEGASYGDDAEMSSNYPIVQLTDPSGSVFYARTTTWSYTGVSAAGDTTPQSVLFTPPAGLPANDYSLVVIANGIPSASADFPYGLGGAPGPIGAGRGTAIGHAADGGLIRGHGVAAPTTIEVRGPADTAAGLSGTGPTAAPVADATVGVGATTLRSDLALAAVVPTTANAGAGAAAVPVITVTVPSRAIGSETPTVAFQGGAGTSVTALGGTPVAPWSQGGNKTSDHSDLGDSTLALDAVFQQGLGAL
jgi:hypothetical protein